MKANESAYPCPVGHIECAHPTGLTKRELIAAMCLQGLCANPQMMSADQLEIIKMHGREPLPQTAMAALNLADALIAELSKDQSK